MKGAALGRPLLVCLLAGLLSFAPSRGELPVKSELSYEEGTVLSLVNEAGLWIKAIYLENISWSHPASRVVGTAGCRAAREWIMKELNSLGLEAWQEPAGVSEDRRQYIWNITSDPYLALDLDNNPKTTNDRRPIDGRINYGSPSTPGMVFSDLVVLPLPSSCEPGSNQTLSDTDKRRLDAYDTTAKVVVYPVEFLKDRKTGCITYLEGKLAKERPLAAIVAPYRQGTQPAESGYGSDFPIIWVTYPEGETIRTLANMSRVCVAISLNTTIGSCQTVYNVVSRLPASKPSGKRIMIGAHYDTVQTPGFVDNSLGVAATLEVARVFSQAAKDGIYLSPYDLEFFFFDGEEFGRLGSQGYVESHRDDLDNVLAVLILDSIGTTYPKFSLSTGTGRDLLPTSHFSSLASDREKLLACGLNLSTFVEESGHSCGLDVGGSAAAKSWGSDHTSFPQFVPAVCLCSGVTLDREPKLYSDLPLVHSVFSDSHTTGEWANAVHALDLEKVAVLTVMRLSRTLDNAYTMDRLTKEISEVVEGLEDSELKGLLEGASREVEESFSKGSYAEGVQRAEEIYCLAQLQTRISGLGTDPAAGILGRIVEIGKRRLEENTSLWYKEAVLFQSDESYSAASIIGTVSALFNQTRGRLEEKQAGVAGRYLSVSITAFEQGAFDRAIRYAEDCRKTIISNIREEGLLIVVCLALAARARRK